MGDNVIPMAKAGSQYKLGDMAASELLLKELYVDLRRSLFNWARVTLQTPQARMGYVGQHLTSVVTGIPGGRSGARGNDLFDPVSREFYEIKTCTRVDQLGLCGKCFASVASIELKCPSCGSDEIVRKDDSKWLIAPQNDSDMSTLFDPTTYFLVLFDFQDLKTAEDINARIFTVDPTSPGFSLCMVDYWLNIRSKSASKAPFNLWPFSFKFELMKPDLIYHAIIHQDDSIDTLIFPERDKPKKVGLSSFASHARAKTFSKEIVQELCEIAGLPVLGSVTGMSKSLDLWRSQSGIDEEEIIDLFCHRVYWENIQDGLHFIPESVAHSMSNFKFNFE